MRRTQCVGIDLGSRVLKAAWLTSADEAPGVLRIERGESDDGAAFERIASALALRGVRGAVVGIVAPNSLVRSTVVDVPSKGSQAPRETIAAGEFYRQLGIESNSCELRIAELPTPTRRSTGDSVLVSGVPRAECDKICQLAARAGLDVVYVATPGDAWVASGAAPASSAIGTMIDVGWESTRVLVTLNGSILLRRIAAGLGLGELLTQLAERHGMKVDLLESLLVRGEPADLIDDMAAGAMSRWAMLAAEDARAAMSYAHHRHSDAGFAPCVCVGGGFGIGVLSEAFEAAASFEVERPSTDVSGWEAVGVARTLARAGQKGNAA